jgi:cell pole-organizing protein PopZ
LYRRPVTRSRPGPDLDEARALVVERDLRAEAVAALTETVKSLPLDALGPVKQSLKRFFSDQPWTEHDDDALADIVGTGSGEARAELAPDLTLVWGWEQNRFFLRLTVGSDETLTAGSAGRARPDRSGSPRKTQGERDDLGLTFETDVRPEVTPSPRTIRFTTPPLHVGRSRVYNSITEAAGDPRVARIFDEFAPVTNVLVGPEFVAITISRPDQWETLLAPMLHSVAEEFTGEASDGPAPQAEHAEQAEQAEQADQSDASSVSGTTDSQPARSPRRLERAWADLGALRADRPDDLERILTATRDAEPARRQVAAALLTGAPAADAAEGWEHLYGDESRSVRRSVVDAVVDARREQLRPLLERALADSDAWIRWKAVRGIADLGVTPSRADIDARASDPDFRVRLEAIRALADNPS